MTPGATERTNGRLAELDRLLQSNGIKIGQMQRRRLDWLVERFGAPLMRDADFAGADGGVIIVAEPPSGAGAELFVRALHAGLVVVIPFGENPVFDFLKSKLTEFGTVGSCGADGPHELWWAGIAWPTPRPNGASSAAPPRVISCFPRGTDDAPARRLRQTLQALQLDCDIEPIATELGDRIRCVEKAAFLLRMWRRYREPLLFVEADALVREPPLLPASLACDVAVHKWNRWEISARTIYLGRSDVTEALLQAWHQLAASHPSIWDGYLLDQAWSLTSSQMPLDTVWLPRSYHALRGELGARRAAIIHDLPTTTTDLGPDPDFAANLRAARLAGRTGAGESLVVMTSPISSNTAVAVILRCIRSSDARAVAASIEALTGAFTRDCGGFGRLELSLCPWQHDLSAAREAANQAQYRVLEIAVGQTVTPDIFCALAQGEGTDCAGRAINDHGGRHLTT